MSERITKIGLDEASNGGRTDWARLRSISDAELEAAIANDPDASLGPNVLLGSLQGLVFKDSRGRWRWRLLGPGGQAIADSPRGYARRDDVDRSLRTLRELMASAEAA